MPLSDREGAAWGRRFHSGRILVGVQTGRPEAQEGEGRIGRVLANGAELAGALTGAAVGLIGGPEAAMAGATAGFIATKGLQRLGAEIIERVGNAEALRVGAAATVIAGDVEQQERSGRKPRDDGFFEQRGVRRPPSEDLLEGVLRQAAAAYEESKVPLLAHLYAGVAYSDVPAADAQYVLRLGDRLTYRQLVAVAVLADEQNSPTLIQAAVTRDEGQTRPSPGVSLELDDLADRGVIGVEVPGGDAIARPNELYGSAGPASAHAFGALKLTPAGRQLHDLMGLDTIDIAEKHSWLRELAALR